MSFAKNTLTAIIAFALLSSALCQTMQKVCDQPMPGVCFHQVTDPRTNTTIGIVLPPKSDTQFHNNVGEALYKIVTPLPYGFAGFSFSNVSDNHSGNTTLELPRDVALGLVTLRTAIAAIGVVQRSCFVQNSVLSQDGSSYIPRNANHGNSFLVSLSAQATYADESEISLVFRCHNCPTAFSPGSALTIIHSLTAPIYPAPDALNATMPVKGATFSRITIEDGDSLRSDQFSAYVKALDV